MELGDSCPICQEEMTDPIELSLCKVRKDIFCRFNSNLSLLTLMIKQNVYFKEIIFF